MQIKIEKNTAFYRQPKPLTAAAAKRKFKPKKARRKLERAEMAIDLMLPVSGPLKFSAEEDKRPVLKARGASHVRVTVENFKLGQHVFPPSIEAKGFKALGNKSRRFSAALQTKPFLPNHLARRADPAQLPKALQTTLLHAVAGQEVEERGNEATTVFLPENRRIFSDTSYPWSACGRVDTPLGQSSGVMVGPRHMLTVSHAIQWNNDGTAGWVRFRPSFFNGSEPFGRAGGIRVYFKWKVNGPTINWIEGMYDYVCVVLDRPIGNSTGWMGARGYTDSWDGGNYWAHVGYPGDLTGGNRPTFENSISLDGAWWQFDSHESMGHLGDVWPGQSGGPFFGWWSGDVGPRAVAVQSSQSSNENYASGGQDMVDLIIRARSQFP